MYPITERLIALNYFTRRMILALTGEKVGNPVVYIGDPEPVRKLILDGKPFSLAGDGRRTAVAYVLDELDTVYNLCITKSDPRLPGVWNLIYERSPNDKGLKKAIFMVDKKADLVLENRFSPFVYKRLKGTDPIFVEGLNRKMYNERMYGFIKGREANPPGDVVSFIFRQYGKGSKIARAVYTYMRMKDTPYGQPYLGRVFKR